MIARIWRGWTTPEHADAFQQLVGTEMLPATARRELPGYRGSYFLRRTDGDEVEFSTIMLFDSIDAVRGFQDDDYELAHVPLAAQALLSRYEERTAHYDLLLGPEQSLR
jgi:antibiotic biosynthesis monooxygenase (ABM) superfamily enzyme